MQDTISQDTVKRVLDQVRQIAAMADFKIDRHPNAEDILIASFDMGAGRSQVVYIRYAGQMPDGHNCVSFFSPCMELKRGVLGSGFSKSKAVELLQRNAQLPFGSFAIERLNTTDLLVVISNQLVETMEVEEMKAHISFVAAVADAYEREAGKDNF